MKGIGKKEEELYILRPKENAGVKEQMKSLVEREITDSELWHKRMGHVPMAVLRRIFILKNKCSLTLDHCGICPLARQVRLPFPHSNRLIVELSHLLN